MSRNCSIGRRLTGNAAVAAAAATEVQASINSAQLNGQGREGGREAGGAQKGRKIRMDKGKAFLNTRARARTFILDVVDLPAASLRLGALFRNSFQFLTKLCVVFVVVGPSSTVNTASPTEHLRTPSSMGHKCQSGVASNFAPNFGPASFLDFVFHLSSMRSRRGCFCYCRWIRTLWRRLRQSSLATDGNKHSLGRVGPEMFTSAAATALTPDPEMAAAVVASPLGRLSVRRNWLSPTEEEEEEEEERERVERRT